MATIKRTEVPRMLSLVKTLYLLLLLSFVDADPSRRPLCVSQLALVNYACSRLPVQVGPSLMPNVIEPSTTISPLPSPSSDVQDPDDQQQETPGVPRQHQRHRHGHGHRHEHRHKGHRHDGPPESPAEENCCKWLNNVDDECVCDLLVRLPSFLARPAHKYTVIVDPSCNVTFSCGMRVKP